MFLRKRIFSYSEIYNILVIINLNIRAQRKSQQCRKFKIYRYICNIILLQNISNAITIEIKVPKVLELTIWKRLSQIYQLTTLFTCSSFKMHFLNDRFITLYQIQFKLTFTCCLSNTVSIFVEIIFVIRHLDKHNTST